MASLAQIEANRGNAQRSTGPRTAAGKQRSRGNAMRHGFFSQHVHCRDEQERAEFEAMRDRLIDELRPDGVMQQWYVEQAAVQIWKLRGLQATEAGWDEKLSRWEQRLIGLIARLVREVSRLQREVERRKERCAVEGDDEVVGKTIVEHEASLVEADRQHGSKTRGTGGGMKAIVQNEANWRGLGCKAKARRDAVLARAVEGMMSIAGRREGKPTDSTTTDRH